MLVYLLRPIKERVEKETYCCATTDSLLIPLVRATASSHLKISQLDVYLHSTYSPASSKGDTKAAQYIWESTSLSDVRKISRRLEDEQIKIVVGVDHSVRPLIEV